MDAVPVIGDTWLLSERLAIRLALASGWGSAIQRVTQNPYPPIKCLMSWYVSCNDNLPGFVGPCRRRYHLTPVSCCSSLIMIPEQSMSNCSHYRTPADICTSRCTKTNKSISRPDRSLSIPDTRSIHIFVQKEKYLLLKDTKNNYLFFIHMTKRGAEKKTTAEAKTGKKKYRFIRYCEKISLHVATLPEQGMFALPTPFAAFAVFLHIANHFFVFIFFFSGTFIYLCSFFSLYFYWS